MASKYELSISTDYVPDWTYVEAIREIFQNALDNEINNSENKMGFSYDEENKRLTVSNKTSVLNPESLLLGSSTKRDDKDTIGKHGEGYKIAFMVLLREGKDIKVYNYGAREIWETKLVKAKRYNNRLVPTIIINKQAIWNKVPNNDLTITVDNITIEEYEILKQKNLNVRDNVDIITETSVGSVLKSKEEKGNIYVKGLFVCHSKDVEYGYNFSPSVVELDRDRKLIDSFNIKWQASRIWGEASKDAEVAEKVAELVVENAKDVEFIKHQYSTSSRKTVSNKAAEIFITEHGDNAYPVSSTVKLERINHSNSGVKPVIVTAEVEETLLESDVIVELVEFKEVPLKVKLENFMEKVESKLNDEELEELQSIINSL